MRDFIEEILGNPIKLWGSVIIFIGILFYVLSGNNDNVTSDPFADSSSYITQEQFEQAEEEYIEDFYDEDSFVEVEEDDMQNDFQEDSIFSEENQFDTQQPFTYKQYVIDSKTGRIVEKEFDIQGNEIRKDNINIDKDKKIKLLEKRIEKLESKLNKDPFLN